MPWDSPTVPENATTLIRDDHHEIEARWRRAREAPENRDLLGEVVRQVTIHDAIETEFLYPRVADLPGGQELVAQATAAHQAVLGRLSDADDPALADLSSAMDDLLRHFAWEETAVLPLLERHLSADEQRALGERLGAAKSVTPTRPHPRLRSDEGLGGGRAVLARAVDRAREWVGRHPNS